MMDKPLVFGQLIPIGVMTIMGLTIIEVKIIITNCRDNGTRAPMKTNIMIQRYLLRCLQY